ncbi:hypothetical protein NYR90_05465 [Clostridioides difficile]|nr:hypothetical protein NYR90_05465 [Clostridioides difficile]
MDLQKFNVDKYVKEHLLLGYYDCNEKNNNDSRQEGLEKQVKSLLYYFTDLNPNSINKHKPDFFMKNIRNYDGKESKYEKDKKKKEEWHILNVFPLSDYEEEDIVKFLNHVFSLKSDVSNKVVANIHKINIDNDISFFSTKIKEDSRYINQISSKTAVNRQIVRRDPINRI